MTTPTPAPALAYSIDDAAALIGMSPSYVKREIGTGRLPAIRLGNRTRILATDLTEWLTRQPTA